MGGEWYRDCKIPHQPNGRETIIVMQRKESGYTSCKCEDCFEIAISEDMTKPEFCWECEEAGCDGESECQVCREEFQ